MALAAELEHTGQHTDFIAKVRRATAVGSAHQDLRAANDALALLDRYANDFRSEVACMERSSSLSVEDVSVTCASLLAHAVILYARATDTTPIDRIKWFSKNKLPADMRVYHDEVMRYRNKALAHFGLNPNLEDGPALSHALVLRNPKGDGYITIAYVESRAHTRARFTERLSELVAQLLPLASERYDARIAEVWASFQKDIMGRSELIEALKNSTFKTELLGAGTTDFFDDEEAREISGHYTVAVPRPR